jgi:methionine aminotransferase
LLINKKQLCFISKRPNVTTSIFAIMSKMTTKNNAVNWAQGFLNFAVDEKLAAIVAEVCFLKWG